MADMQLSCCFICMYLHFKVIYINYFVQLLVCILYRILINSVYAAEFVLKTDEI